MIYHHHLGVPHSIGQATVPAEYIADLSVSTVADPTVLDF